MMGENGGQKQSGAQNIYCDSTNKNERKELIEDLEHLFISNNNKHPYKGKTLHSPPQM